MSGITNASLVRFIEPTGPVKLEVPQAASPALQLQSQSPSDFSTALMSPARPMSSGVRGRSI